MLLIDTVEVYAIFGTKFLQVHIVTTNEVLLGEGTPSGIGLALSASGILNARSALSLMVFYLFYFPCVATLVVQPRPRRLLLPLLFAYAAAVVVYWV